MSRGEIAALAWRVPLGAIVGLVVLVLPAWTYARIHSPHGTWAAAGAWSLVALWAVIGLAGGALLTGVGAALRGWRRVEDELAAWIARRGDAAGARRLPLAEVRARGDVILDQVLASLARLRLPGSVLRLARWRLHRMLVGDFVDDCERRGLATAGGAEFAAWLATGGPAFVTGPIRAQLELWRWLLIAAFVLLGAVPLALLVIRSG